MHINEGKDKLALFYTAHNVLPTPPFSILFPSSIFSFSLLYNFIIFPPQCFYSLLHNFFIIFLPQCFLFPSTTILIFSFNFIIFPPQCYYSLLYNFIIFPPLPPPCLLYTSPSPRDGLLSRMPSSA